MIKEWEKKRENNIVLWNVGINFQLRWNSYAFDSTLKVKEPKRKKEKKEETFEHLGHKFLSIQLGIHTACELCGNFLWLMEKGYVCQGKKNNITTKKHV